MKITTIGIVEDGPIDLGFESGDETNILADVVPMMGRAPNTAWLQELEEINQIIQAEKI